MLNDKPLSLILTLTSSSSHCMFGICGGWVVCVVHKMNSNNQTNLIISKRRSLTRILAFLVIVCFDINRSRHVIKTIVGGISTDDKENNGKNSSSALNHIQTIESNHNTTDANVRISFQLHDPDIAPFKDLYAPHHGCALGELSKGGGHRVLDLPSALHLDGNGGRVLDFTTTLSSNLKILQLGDSVTFQMSEALDEMFGAEHAPQKRHYLWEAFPGGEGGTLVAPTRGGGVHGAWRITALLSEGARGGPDTKNKPGGGWNYHQVFKFTRHVYPYDGKNSTVGKDFDVVIFRVMHGWMTVEQITRERVVEAASMAHKVLGAQTIVFITAPFTNNVLTKETYEGVSNVNEMIHDVANKWHLEHADTNSTVLVMDYANYVNEVMWTNARHLGYKNVSDPLTVTNPKVYDEEGPNFLLERLNVKTWPPSIPQVCNKLPPPESDKAFCERNMLFADGMHMCTERLAARIGAGLACLLGCVYNRSTRDGSAREELPQTNPARIQKIRACEQQCNKQFLSVLPVKESWINVDDPKKNTAKSTTLASFSGL